MRRLRTKLCVGTAMTAALTGLTPAVPGCGSLRFDPQVFLAQNTCNIFNCDTLFFLESLLSASPDGGDEVETEGPEGDHEH